MGSSLWFQCQSADNAPTMRWQCSEGAVAFIDAAPYLAKLRWQCADTLRRLLDTFLHPLVGCKKQGWVQKSRFGCKNRFGCKKLHPFFFYWVHERAPIGCVILVLCAQIGCAKTHPIVHPIDTSLCTQIVHPKPKSCTQWVHDCAPKFIKNAPKFAPNQMCFCTQLLHPTFHSDFVLVAAGFC